MTTLDDVYEQMRAFQRALLEFNQVLRLSATDLRKSDEQIAALWQDEAALRYRRAYEPLAEALSGYFRSDAPRFERFLQAKIEQLNIYLHGE